MSFLEKMIVNYIMEEFNNNLYDKSLDRVLTFSGNFRQSLKFYVQIEHDDILLLTIDKDKFHDNRELLYETILGPLTKKDFVSFTQTDNEVSLFISKHLLSKKEKKFYDVTDQPTYSSFRFYHNFPGIKNIGIVNKISNLFIGLNIPIIYVNSYGNSYILIESRFKEHAIQRVIEKPNYQFVESF